MDGVGDDTLERLLDALALHVTALADDTRFAAHTNHGFFQAAGQLAMARRLPGLPGMDAASAQGAARLRALVDQQFAADGMHREHSPGYHDAVLSALGAILDAGLLDDPELHAIRRRSEDALAWLVLPDGTLAPFGDTDAEDRPAAAGEDAHPHLRFMLSGGREGEAPGDLVRGFQSGGYAVCRRLPPGDPAGGSYLAQICAFHSRTHKHADHLAVIWHERGHDLLVEAGRYDYLGRLDPRSSLGRQGFWYSDPRRVYVESTRAHNTVEIDRRPHARRSVAPFGSALARHGEEAGIAYVESQVRHRRSVVQTRLLLFDPGRWLIVLDNLSDTSGQTHRYVQRFLFGPELDLAPLGQGFALRIPGEAQRLYVAPLLPSAPVAAARGQEQPELAGWVSRRARAITPAWTAGFEVEGTARHTFATLLALGDAKPIPDPERCRANVTGRRARLAWRIGDEDVQVDVDRESEEVGIRVRRRAWPPPDPAVTE
jgi:hypothetical protein